MDRDDAAWLAGVLEVRGCITHRRGRPRLAFATVNEGLVREVADLIGCTVTERPIGDDGDYCPFLYTADVNSEALRAVLKEVLPHIRCSLRRAELLAVL